MADQNNAPELRIDGKWSIRYDPENNYRPIEWRRHGEWSGRWVENNAVTAMFYALLEARADRAALFPKTDGGQDGA